MEVGTSNINLLRLKCVILNSPISVLNIILHMLYILTLYILVNHSCIMLLHNFCCINYDSMDVIYQ